MTMKSTQIQQFKRSLEAQRDEAFRLLHRVGDESRSIETDIPQDSGDQSINSVSKEFLFQQGSQRRGMVRRIEAALSRIEEGTFGVCTECSEEIPMRRLEALPWTDFCLHCQEQREKTGTVRLGSQMSEIQDHV
jgi:DnaK suppressor protein